MVHSWHEHLRRSPCINLPCVCMKKKKQRKLASLFAHIGMLQRMKLYLWSLHRHSVVILSCSVATAENRKNALPFTALLSVCLVCGVAFCTAFQTILRRMTSVSLSLVILSASKLLVLIPKTIGNRKRDCAWGCARRINTTSENLQIEKHKSGRRSFRSPDWFVLFDLQIFSGGV